jgi:mercuric ion transport protein
MAESVVNEPKPQGGKRRPGVLLSLGALLPAAGVFASWLCCLLPISLGAAGVGMSAFGAKIEPFRPYFVGITFVLLGLAFYQAYRPVRESCEDGKICARPDGRRVQRIALWAFTFVSLLLMAAPYWLGLFAQWGL